MRISMLPWLIFAGFFGAMALLLAAAAEPDTARVIGAIVFAYLAVVQLALVVVRRWARQMAAS